MNNKAIRLRLTELRKAKHITQIDLANLIGVSFQTISKWENGVTMPDISVLPTLADYFQISVDELLGLKPLENEVYLSENTDSNVFWDNHLEYIMRSKSANWNDDYLRFLIRDVWKIDGSVDVLDCGCGDARFAPTLMTSLPQNSTYTGIDFSSSLTDKAKILIDKYNIHGQIITGDFLTSNFNKKFDIVICQSVLRHIGDSKIFRRKMIDAAIKGGLVICIDTNRELECCGLYIDGIDYGELCDHSGAIRHWKNELENGKRDYAAAMRNAYVMRELGLVNINIRMNDKVSYVCPEQDDYEKNINNFIKSKRAWYTDTSEAIERLINHGMTRREAHLYVGKSNGICEYLERNKGEVAYTQFKGKTITYGWKGE